VITAASNGTTAITVTDADGKTASTLDINVGKKASQNPGNPDPGNPGNPGDGSCPIGDQSMCDIICQIKPDLPFCKQ
jgi:thermitase